MAATVSAMSQRPLQPAWTTSHKLREAQKTPVRNSSRKRGAVTSLPMEYIDPGRAELRSVLVRTHAVMHRTKSGQDYEKAVKVVNAEYWKPPKTVPGEWFPHAGQVFDLKKGSMDAKKVDYFCDILEKMPFLLKALDRIKISWLRNNYPLPQRIVRALDRDDFELISSNFPGPIGDVNRYPGAMWTMTTNTSSVAHRKSQARPLSRRDTSAGRYSKPLDRRDALVADPNLVPKSVVPHRRDWNRLVHRYLDDCVSALGEAGQQRHQLLKRLSSTGQEHRTLGGPSALDTEQVLSPPPAAASADGGTWEADPPSRPVSRLMEPLYPVWQTVREAERGDRRLSDLNTVSADDAKLIMKRCRQLKSDALSQMDQQYKAKINKLEDNREQRYRRKVSYLVPPYRTAGADMPAIRRRVQRRSRLEDVTLRNAVWFCRLGRVAESLGATELPRCRPLLERLEPFSRRDGSQIAHGSERLCLLLCSVPIYDALQSSLQMAALFVHVHYLGGSENVFRRWLEARGLADTTTSSPLIGLIRDPTSREEEDFSSDEDSS